MGEGRPAVVLRDNRGDQAYEAEVDGEVIGIVGYQDARGRRVLGLPRRRAAMTTSFVTVVTTAGHVRPLADRLDMPCDSIWPDADHLSIHEKGHDDGGSNQAGV